MAGATGGGKNFDNGDPRTPSVANFGDNAEPTRNVVMKIIDPSVVIERYMHFTAITRADDRQIETPTTDAMSRYSTHLRAQQHEPERRKPLRQALL